MTTTIVDMHCHLCAGLDDGPQTSEQSLEMCEIAHRNGTGWIAATAHQGETWPKVSPTAILDSVKYLVEQLKQHINAFVKAYNKDAEPFVWTKSKVHQRRVKGRRLSEL
jgi:tyrosine-protein phosphatase YwqE